VHLLFNNAGIGGGGSFVTDERADWERTFGICWGGVYNGTRAFLPMLVAADEGTSSTPAASTGSGRRSGPTWCRTPPTARRSSR
jgi:NADP-dependent 3-hydroxy acid dehydrogenase YdfG